MGRRYETLYDVLQATVAAVGFNALKWYSFKVDLLTLTYRMSCRSRWNIGHRPLVTDGRTDGQTDGIMPVG